MSFTLSCRGSNFFPLSLDADPSFAVVSCSLRLSLCPHFPRCPLCPSCLSRQVLVHGVLLLFSTSSDPKSGPYRSLRSELLGDPQSTHPQRSPPLSPSPPRAPSTLEVTSQAKEAGLFSGPTPPLFFFALRRPGAMAFARRPGLAALNSGNGISQHPGQGAHQACSLESRSTAARPFLLICGTPDARKDTGWTVRQRRMFPITALSPHPTTLSPSSWDEAFRRCLPSARVLLPAAERNVVPFLMPPGYGAQEAPP